MISIVFFHRTERNINAFATDGEFKVLPFEPAFNKHEETPFVMVSVQEVVG